MYLISSKSSNFTTYAFNLNIIYNSTLFQSHVHNMAYLNGMQAAEVISRAYLYAISCNLTSLIRSDGVGMADLR